MNKEYMFGEWILINEKRTNMPDFFEEVIVQFQDGHICISFYSKVDKEIVLEKFHGKAVAWMPLPEPYQKK